MWLASGCTGQHQVRMQIIECRDGDVTPSLRRNNYPRRVPLLPRPALRSPDCGNSTFSRGLAAPTRRKNQASSAGRNARLRITGRPGRPALANHGLDVAIDSLPWDRHRR